MFIRYTNYCMQMINDNNWRYTTTIMNTITLNKLVGPKAQPVQCIDELAILNK